MFAMTPLPYDMSALEPYMSARTLEFHYGRHYKTYVDTLNKLAKGTRFENMSLPDVVRESYGHEEYQTLFNNAGQVWNHEFFWQSMKLAGGGLPPESLQTEIERQFGSFEAFREEFKKAALSQFGSGWIWLVRKDGKLRILKTANADTPLTAGLQPLFTLDVWEHAYYLDFQNRRADYADNFFEHLIDWQRAAMR